MIDVRRFGETTTDLDTRGNQPGMGGRETLQRDTLRNDERRSQRARDIDQDLRDRGAAFSKALTRVAREAEQGDAAQPDPRVLLAVLERPASPFTLIAAESARTAMPTPSSDAAARVAQLVEATATEQARLALSASTTIAIPVDTDGLQSVTLAISPDGVDVTLVQAGDAGSLSWPDMARDLAERLQARLGRRRVRIYQETLASGGQSARQPPTAAASEDEA
jgi:hypothetical protein